MEFFLLFRYENPKRDIGWKILLNRPVVAKVPKKKKSENGKILARTSTHHSLVEIIPEPQNEVGVCRPVI